MMNEILQTLPCRVSVAKLEEVRISCAPARIRMFSTRERAARLKFEVLQVVVEQNHNQSNRRGHIKDHTSSMAWNQGKAKENANPTILSVSKEKSHVGFDWSDLGTFEKGEDEWIPSSAEDMAIFKALTEAANATGGRNVNLLKHSGMTFSSSLSTKRRSVPKFKFSTSNSDASSSTNDSQINETPRDKISSEEIFDIIRTIQDPEHPNTLEELGVVSLAQVQVSDSTTESDMSDGPPKLSSVSVRFT